MLSSCATLTSCLRRGLTVLAALSSLAVVAQAQVPDNGPMPPPAPLRIPHSMPMPADPKLPTIFLIGDSTVRNGQGTGTGGMWGWGDEIAPYFDTTQVNVVNRAVGGLSSRTYLTGGHWDPVKAMLKPGDFVLMQFGHNDGGAINDASRARASLPGIGEDSQAIDNMLTKQHEIVHSYGWYLRKFIDDAKAQGATPIVCSPIPRKSFVDGKVPRDKYADWAKQTAQGDHTLFVDLNAIIAEKYDALGPAKVEPLFGDPHTHTSLAGAQLNAACVVAGLKALKDDPIVKYFSPKAADVTSATADQVAAP
jgi:lysophospholipase L1-like esterase